MKPIVQKNSSHKAIENGEPNKENDGDSCTEAGTGSNTIPSAPSKDMALLITPTLAKQITSRATLLKPPVLTCFAAKVGKDNIQTPQTRTVSLQNQLIINRHMVDPPLSSSIPTMASMASYPSVSFGLSTFHLNRPDSSFNESLRNLQLANELESMKKDKENTTAKIKEKDEKIMGYKDLCSSYKKKLLEWKLHDEVRNAQTYHNFQDILLDFNNLAGKLNACSEAEWYPRNPDTEVSKRINEIRAGSNCVNETSVTDLENKDFNSIRRSIQSIQDNMTCFMVATNGKLSKILDSLGSQNFNMRHSLPSESTEMETCNAIISETTNCIQQSLHENNITEYNNKHEMSAGTDLNSEQSPSSLSTSSEISDVPTDISDPMEVDWSSKALKKGQGNSKNLTKSYKRTIRKRKRDESHQSDTSGSDNEQNDEKPPVLCLPSRLARESQNRSNSMPVLHPEQGALSQQSSPWEFAERLGVPVKMIRAGDKRQIMSDSENELNYTYLTNPIVGNVMEVRKERRISSKTSSKVHGRDESKTGFICLCGSKFTAAGGLYVHQVKLMESEKFRCDLCGKRFHYFSGLKAHRKATHKLQLTQEVGCSRCGQIFRCKADRQGHLDERGRTCWLSGSYQNKEGASIRKRSSC